jgi:Trk K+ transport system NAD-binding subunit
VDGGAVGGVVVDGVAVDGAAVAAGGDGGAAEYAGWCGHVIVCGLHGVGLRAVEQFVAAEVPVVVVDDEPDRSLVRQLAAWRVPYLAASARMAETLQAAGIAGARALVCVEEDDVHTLETTLLARRLRADLRIVVEMRNPAVGGALAEVTGAGTVLDTAVLSAPSVVEACVRADRHEFDLAGERFAVRHATVAGTGTLRTLYGDLAPIAVVPEGGADMVICPGRDHRVCAGDRVSVVGADGELPPGSAATAGGRRRRRSWLRHALASLAAEVDQLLRWTLLALLVSGVVSTVVVRLAFRPLNGQRMSTLDAAYFTVVTDATVGYGDFHFSGQPGWLVMFGILDIVTGAALAAALFAQLTNLLVNRRLAQALGRQRITGMSGHVIVVGLGTVGIRVLQGIQRHGMDVVVVERDESNRYLAQARAMGVPVVIADAAQAATLTQVGLDDAAAVAVMTSSDLTNIEIGLAVRERLGPRWNDVPVVLRVLDRPLAVTVEHNFRFRYVRSTAALAAPWFVGAALGLDVLDTFYVDHQPFLLGRLSVTAGGGLDGTAMQDLSARTRVIALSRPGTHALEHPPRRDTRFGPGDVAYIVGPYEELLAVLRQEQLRPAARS